MYFKKIVNVRLPRTLKSEYFTIQNHLTLTTVTNTGTFTSYFAANLIIFFLLLF